MKKIITIFVALEMCALSLQAQNMTTVIKTEALKMAKALAVMDIETYATFMYPTLVSDRVSMGKIKQGMDSVNKYRDQFGLKVKQILIGNPSAVKTYKGIMQCILPQTTTVESMMGTISLETTLIGLSKNGTKWYFVDAMLYKQKESKEKLPELSSALVIPPMKPPVMTGTDGKTIN